MQDIIINVSEAGTAAARTFAYEITVDGRVIARGALTPVQSQQVNEIGSQYFSLWETKGQEQAVSYLPLLKDALGRLFLDKAEQGWRESIASDARLVIYSSIRRFCSFPGSCWSFPQQQMEGSGLSGAPAFLRSSQPPCPSHPPGRCVCSFWPLAWRTGRRRRRPF